MKKNSTPLSIIKTPCKKTTEFHARPSTLSALMQFARAYSYEPKLQGDLGNFVAN